MKHLCLDFNGTAQWLRRRDQRDTFHTAISNRISASAHTVIVAFWLEAVRNTFANGYENPALVADSEGYFALAVRGHERRQKAARL